MPYNNQIDRNDSQALMPEEVADSIIKDLPQTSVTLQMFRQTRMARKQQRQPVLASLPTAYWVNGDTGLQQTSDVNWTNQYLNAEDLAVIVPVPRDVLADTAFDIWAETKPLLVEAIGIAIDSAILFGTNKPASWPAALVPAAVAAGNTFLKGSVAGKDLASDVSSVMTLVETDGFDVNGFYARRSMKGALRDLRDSQNRPIFQPSLVAGTPDTLYGESVRYDKAGIFDATVDLMAGDWTRGIIGLRQDMEWRILDQAVLQDNTGAIIYNLAQQNMVAMQVIMRVAFQVANPLTRLNPNGTTRYPFAVLKNA